MDKNALNKLLTAQEALMTDRRYLKLYQEYQSRSSAFLSFMEKQENPDAVWDYLGVCVEMHLHLLELICKDTPAENK